MVSVSLASQSMVSQEVEIIRNMDVCTLTTVRGQRAALAGRERSRPRAPVDYGPRLARNLPPGRREQILTNTTPHRFTAS